MNVSRYVVIVRSTIEGEKGVVDEGTGREENHAESRRRRGQREDTEEDASRYCIFFFSLLYFVLSSVALFLLFLPGRGLSVYMCASDYCYQTVDAYSNSSNSE